MDIIGLHFTSGVNYHDSSDFRIQLIFFFVTDVFLFTTGFDNNNLSSGNSPGVDMAFL